ncbi:response regulator [Candidatus Neomarinimicrobiota bacterium]
MTDNATVLIVDDDVHFADSTADLLSEKGFHCVGVNSGLEAINKVKETTFDVILLDMKMPVLNGVETYKEIKKIAPQTIVVLVTAYRVEELIREALREGAYAVLKKPLDFDRVVQIIERAKKGGALILVVDEDPNASRYIKENLEQHGFVVSVPDNSMEASKIAKERPYNVIFIDTQIPSLSAFIIYLEIKKINPDVITVILTGQQEEMDRLTKQSFEHGAYACLYKPFSVDKVLHLLDEVIEMKKLGTNQYQAPMSSQENYNH